MLVQFSSQFVLFSQLEKLTTDQLRTIIQSDADTEKRKFAAIIVFKRLQPQDEKKDAQTEATDECGECDKLTVQLTKVVRLNTKYLSELKTARSQLFAKNLE